MASPVILATLAVYLLVLVGIGLWGSRESQDLAGYYAAGKKLPAWVIAFSTNATGESAWLLLGLTGMGYLLGVHALWVSLGEILGVAAAWVFIARPFKAYTDRYDSITVPDYLTDRLGDRFHLIRWISLAVICSMVTAYTSAQLIGSGKAFESFLGLDYRWGVVLGAAIVLFYTAVGGFKAVAYSDLLQGVLMFGGLLILPFVGLAAAGGWGATMDKLAAADPALLRPMGAEGLTLKGVVSALSLFGIGLGFLGSPQLLARFISAKNTEEIVKASLLSVVCIIVFDLGAVFAGISGRALFPGLDDAETIMPKMSAELFPALFTGLYLAIVLAAIMSTVDSLLIMASSSVMRDVVQKVFRPKMSERRLSNWSKLVTVAIGGLALTFALTEPRAIFWFVVFAWSGLASAFTPAVLCSLYWKRTTLAGAVAGMIGGFAVTVIWVVVFKARFHDLLEMYPGFAAGFALTIGVSLLTRPREGAGAELDAIHRSLGHPLKARRRRS